MKLAEALILRADYKKRIAQLNVRLQNSSKVQEGEEPPENPQQLLKELDTIMNELTVLIQRINRTNSLTNFDDKYSLADILAERDKIWDKRQILSQLIKSAVVKQDRYSRSEVKFFSTVDIGKIQKEVDRLSKVFRELDTKIQSKNWTTELK
ncbi:DIP1984 family protein [Clostridiisalibacter paucivorans]|uniref:DIP1984 family protein n=1 Tax=Clostridiisalibacter paucivorans TaxID=408753 RepID=UPI00047AE868|nr:DIP1984 family protein [Clostridiisalibacter paucivorans]